MHRLALACLAVALSVTARADPEQDREAFRAYFLQRFPDVPVMRGCRLQVMIRLSPPVGLNRPTGHEFAIFTLFQITRTSG